LKKNILIYGAGNIAIRHVQSIISENSIAKIYVFDKKKSALKKMLNFFCKDKNKNKLTFFNEQKKLKNKFFFLAFLCTYAFNRIRLIKKIKRLCKIRYFIVEKILESNISNFKKITFNTKNIFVNMPLRNIKPFRIINSKLNSKKIHATIKGGNWHMICNSLHYINYVSYITNSMVHKILIKKLNKPYKLLRKNFIDFHGNIKVFFENGSILNIVSLKNAKKHYFNLKQGQKKFNYNFKNDKLTIGKQFLLCKREYISKLSNKFYKSLLKTEKVKLPTFEEALKENFLFIEQFLKKIKKKTYILKIT
jgi:hypothetical protein